MKSAPLAILYFLLASLLGAIGQFFYRAGAERAGGSLSSYLNSWIALGAGCYIAVMVLFVAAFRQYPMPSVLYPIYAATFVWAVLIDHVAYGRGLVPANFVGAILLVGGMYLIGKQS